MEFKKKQFLQKGKNKVKIIPLGGVEEIGINSTAIEYDNKIVIVDYGLGFPENDEYGVDYLIPNSNYLVENKKRIVGLFITHGHLDHIGGIHLLLKKLDFPKIYAPAFAAELIKLKLKEHDLLEKTKFDIYNERSKYTFGKLSVDFFRVNHSTPDSYGFAIGTEHGYVVHTGDFKFDNSPVGEPTASYGKIAYFGRKGVIAMLSDSTNSFKKGHSKSESEVSEILKDIVEKADGRVIVATFSQLVLRINQLLLAANALGRKVAISGRSLEQTLNIARNLGYINAPDDLFVPIHRIKTLPLHKQMILTTGHQGETMAALSRIARGEHKDVKVGKGDTVILSSSIIPGNEILIQNMVDELSQQGAKVIHQAIMDLHAGGHGYQEDQKLMLNLAKPKFFIPVHGYQSFLIEHGRTAQSLGIPENNVIISKRGKEILIDRDGWTFGKQHSSNPVFVSGLGVGDIGETILAEREQLAKGGVIIISIDKTNLTNYQITSKGFVYFRSYSNIQKGIEDTVRSTLDANKTISNIGDLANKVERAVSKYVNKEIERNPMIITIIN